MIEERGDDGVTWLTADRPDRLNSFTADDYRDLHLALSRLEADPATRVVVLSGRGRAFSAGADRSLLSDPSGEADGRRAGAEFDRLVTVLSSFDKPLFAAVNGLAVGFGATLLLYCDFVVAAESARLRMPFTSLGLVPEAGSSVLLASRMRWADAMWAVLSSEWLDAHEAARAGLVWRVAPDGELVTVVADYARRVADRDPSSVRAAKRLLTAGRAEAVRAGLVRELAEMTALFGHRR